MFRFLLFLMGVTGVTLGVLWYAGVLDMQAQGDTPTDLQPVTPGERSKVAKPLRFGNTPPGTVLVETRRDGTTRLVMAGLTVNPRDTHDVSFRVDGKLTEIPVKEGMIVDETQVLGILDTQIIDKEVQAKKLQAESETVIAALTEAVALAKKIVERDEKNPAATAPQQAEINAFKLAQARAELTKAEEEKAIHRMEYEQKLTLLKHHTVRSGIKGRVDRVLRKPNESVKAGDVVFRIVNLEKLHLDGAFEKQRIGSVKIGDKVIVEPERLAGWEAEMSGHTATVNGLAITADGRFLVSCSDDRSVRLWNAERALQVKRMNTAGSAVEVYAVAADPTRKTKLGEAGTYFFIAAGADGWIRTWTVEIDADGAVTKEQLGELPRDAHRGAVRAVAISPDGKWFATGGEDRRIGIWRAGSDKPAYFVRKDRDERSTAHRGAVTTLHFTPDGHLLSAAADKTIHKWKLGENEAELVWEEAGRTGDVVHLGISPDGRRMFYEVDEELRILDTETQATLDALQNRKQGSFTNLAVFSPTTKFALTTTAAGRVQLWTLPTPEEFAKAKETGDFRGLPRPHEIRKLVPPDNSAVKCAVFDPQDRFVATAGADKMIRVWRTPDDKERTIPLEATIIDIGENVASGTGLVRIRAEMDNPKDERRLKPGDLVNLTLEPKR